ncbi:N-acetylmuramidase family protein [Acinetobacter baumannii]|uniref:N-acetylmuramidase domain-containing protein n=1 Tax=Acinetobacter baumannii TaxID=470 RepID=UPI0003B90C68|nr:N-acetylmuramidase family protein [Acinetobacter baumannii]MDH2600856.1 N-acetylmuramidase family protein [Acinetobacter baumannii]CDG77662.1 phage-related cell wall hydrolase [Acinetobacter baumannii 107m]
MIIKFGARGEAVIEIQKKLKELGFKGKNGKVISTDGIFGESTEYAVIQFQKTKGLLVDGKVGDKTRDALNGSDISKFLKDSDYVTAAKRLKVSELAIRVFGATEGRGLGFLKNGKAKILFERHRMYFYLAQFKGKAFANAQMKASPSIVNTVSGGYKGNEAEYTRLRLAQNIHPESALMSCSWGQFQIMGENWKELGYQSVFDFVEQMQTSESLQLEAFIRFIEWKTGTVNEKKVSLLDALRAEDWPTVFSLYNGPNYKKLGYQAKFQREWDHLEPIYGGKKVA